MWPRGVSLQDAARTELSLHDDERVHDADWPLMLVKVPVENPPRGGWPFHVVGVRCMGPNIGWAARYYGAWASVSRVSAMLRGVHECVVLLTMVD
jgi:hypothetical protein